MTKIYIDTEFVEGEKSDKHYLELISVGLVKEDGTEYYGISNEFDFNYAWDLKDSKSQAFWIRENVLKSIALELDSRHILNPSDEVIEINTRIFNERWQEDIELIKSNLQRDLELYGLTRKQMAKDIIDFTKEDQEVKCVGYYSSYDWVVLCSIFGRMLDLPNNFNWVCLDIVSKYNILYDDKVKLNTTFNEWFGTIVKSCNLQPARIKHNALDDAKMIRDLDILFPVTQMLFA